MLSPAGSGPGFPPPGIPVIPPFCHPRHTPPPLGATARGAVPESSPQPGIIENRGEIGQAPKGRRDAPAGDWRRVSSRLRAGLRPLRVPIGGGVPLPQAGVIAIKRRGDVVNIVGLRIRIGPGSRAIISLSLIALGTTGRSQRRSQSQPDQLGRNFLHHRPHLV